MEKNMNQKTQNALKKITAQRTTLIGKGERFQPAVQFLKQADPSLKEKTRQRLEGDLVGNVIKTKDVMTLLNQNQLGCRWGVISLDKLMEWAWNNGYLNLAELKQDFELVELGGTECTVEIACDPQRQDLINSFQKDGITGLTKFLKSKEEKIATDKPGIAASFVGAELLIKLSGSLEALPKQFAPVIIGVVETGNSLKEENWLRLSKINQQAVLLRSQLMLVIKKRKLSKKVIDLETLYQIICSRQQENLKKSYVASLFNQGRDKIIQKVGEEAIEVVIAAKEESKERIISEVADLVFHLLVLLVFSNIQISAVIAELKKRNSFKNKKYNLYN